MQFTYTPVVHSPAKPQFLSEETEEGSPFKGGGEARGSSRECLERGRVDSREIHQEDSVKIQLQLATDESRYWNNERMRYGEYF